MKIKYKDIVDKIIKIIKANKYDEYAMDEICNLLIKYKLLNFDED